MKSNTSDKTTAFSKKKLSFILPAVLTGLLVFDMIPQTQVTLQEIPERLALVEEVAADTGADASGNSEAGGLKRAAKEKEDGEQAVGDYEDGVYTGTSQGYGGPVTVEVTVKDGQITDVKIVSAAGETEPYLSLAKSVIDQVMQKQTWEVDVASGATYSSRGILGAIQNALTGETVENAAAPKVEPQGSKQQDSFKDPDAYKDGTYTGTAQGFGGPITVKVVIKNGKIKSISIESAGGETSSYLSRAKGVISSILKKGSPNVDTVSGATYSSTGIINAVKRALSKASADGSKKTKETKQKKTKKKASTSTAAKQDSYTEPAAYKDGTYYGTAEGFGGNIQVKVVISNGKLSSITIVSAADETKEYLDKAKAVINTMLQKGSPNVDSISGATFSSTGIINAVKRAMSQAAVNGSSSSNNASSNGVSSGTAGQTTPSNSSVMPSETLKDGVYTGTGNGYGGAIEIQLTVSGGRMTDIVITSADRETAAYLNRAKSLIGTVLSNQSADVDTISGATFSSSGIRDAIKAAISKAAGTEENTSGNTGGNTSGGNESEDPAGEAHFKNGQYTKTGMCKRDGLFDYDINVTVVVSDEKISDVVITKGEDFTEDSSHIEENDGYLDYAINGQGSSGGMKSRIIAAQSASVDIVSGATYSSNTIKSITAEILNEIRIDAAKEEEEVTNAQTAKAKAVAAEEAAAFPQNLQQGEEKTVQDSDASGSSEAVTAEKPDSGKGEEAPASEDNASGTSEKNEATEKEKTEDQSEDGADLKEGGSSKSDPAEAGKKESEAEKKQKAEDAAKKKAEEEAKKKAEEEAKKKAEEEAKKKAEAEAKKKAEEEAKKKAEEEAKKKAAEEAEAKAAAQAAQAAKESSDDEKDA